MLVKSMFFSAYVFSRKFLTCSFFRMALKSILLTQFYVTIVQILIMAEICRCGPILLPMFQVILIFWN